MTRDEAVSVIAGRLGNRTGAETKIIAEMKLRQAVLEHAPELPWFLLTRSSALATVANQQTVNTPADFLREFEDVGLYVVDTDGKDQPLDKDDFEALQRSGLFETNGLPTNYDLIGNNFYLFPTPDIVYTLKSFYYAAALTLTSDIENAWLKYAPDLLIADTGIVVARFFRDPVAAQMFKEERSEAFDVMQRENISRKEAARSAVMGG